MSRRSDLEAASAKQKAAIARLTPPKNLKQAQAIITNYGSLVKQLEELAKLPPDAPTAPPTAPPTSTPTVPGNAAALNKAWDHDAAAEQINAKLIELNKQGIADVDAQLEALGPELAGKAIALGRYHGQDVDESLADPYGGRWGVSTGYDETGYWAEVRHASKVVHREVDPVKSPDPLTVGRAHGLNDRLDGPA